MLQYSQCKIDYQKDTPEELKRTLAGKLHISENDLRNIRIERKSVDARKKPELYFNYSVVFSCRDEKELLRRNQRDHNLKEYHPQPDLMETIHNNFTKTDETTVIIGSGPAGLFCGYFLALCGRKPVIIERGAPMWERVGSVERFWKEGILDSETNVSFGEGGAGTFSDGKLNTGVKDKTGKKKFILDTFVEHGAPEEIRYLAKPHIGTDELREVMISMREKITEMGGTYLFHTKFTGFVSERAQHSASDEKERQIVAVETVDRQGNKKRIACDRCVLAIGHSARDTFTGIHEAGIAMEAKPFAVGVRVEHSQKWLNERQYGRNDDRLPAADYKLTGKTSDGRGVYSFCMCPGGYVVNASTEEGGTVVNGMSNHARDAKNANSAIVVTVDEKDFGSEDVLAGVEFQRKLEQNTFRAGGGNIPVQRFGDFLNGVPTTELGEFEPCVKGKFVLSDVKKILPSYISNGIIEGMRQFGTKMKGFDGQDTLLLGTETRTSSPVRILRDRNFQSESIGGVYPCGEGAGYAGGIMSAAMDGLRVAVQIVSERNKKEE